VKKTWHVWAAFVFCLAVGLLGMTWLSVRVVELDHAEAAARREAERARRQTEVQERIAAALWRMDWTLTPLIAEEATRPSFAYRPFLESPSSKGGLPAVASPLLTDIPDYVVLNFDVSADNSWTSPQSPSDVEVPFANAAGLSDAAILDNRRKLVELSHSVSYQQLLNLLPEALLPSLSQADNGIVDHAAASSFHVSVLNEYGQRRPGRPADRTDSEQAESFPQRTVESPPPHALPAEPGQPAALPPSRQVQREVDGQPAQPFPMSRAQEEWNRRNVGMQNVARSQRAQIVSNQLLLPDSVWEREGVSRPLWIDSRLILARRVVSNGDVRIQGSWLDWPQIKRRLKEEVADLFPDIELQPVTDGVPASPGRLLATLPVQLVVPATMSEWTDGDTAGSASLSAIRISLVITWCCLLLASTAVAVMLRGILSLSERRASFVSAVTHELRSPLTTFRMYAEMLAEGMVRDEQQRNRYLATLRQEADRLSHLVDNVLQYARLERGRRSRRRAAISLSDLMRQTTERLSQRARQAGMELHETSAITDTATTVLTDPAAVEQILFNLVDNACKYASRAEDRRIHLHWSVGNRVAQVRVTDHGPGIRPAQAARLFRPFSKSDQEAAHSAPGIGLGLALSRRLARDIGGTLHLDTRGDAGATFLLEIPLAENGRSTTVSVPPDRAVGSLPSVSRDRNSGSDD
jgi:signal transduction histidine kinase